MRFPARKRPRYAIAPPLISLVDIVLLLLIYFLLTSDYVVRDGMEVTLPQAATAAATETGDMVVGIDARGRVFLEGREMPLSEALVAVAEALRREPGRSVLVSADRSVDLGAVVRVMDGLRGAGAARLVLETERNASPGGD